MEDTAFPGGLGFQVPGMHHDCGAVSALGLLWEQTQT